MREEYKGRIERSAELLNPTCDKGEVRASGEVIPAVRPSCISKRRLSRDIETSKIMAKDLRILCPDVYLGRRLTQELQLRINLVTRRRTLSIIAELSSPDFTCIP